MKLTQRQRVKAKLLADGYVDNFWCIENKISTRLGAIIFVLRNEGMEIGGGFIEGTKNFRYTLNKRPKRFEMRIVERDGVRMAVPFEV